MSVEELKEIFDSGILKGDIKFDESMAAHTSLKIGGPVDIMISPEDPVSLKHVLLAAKRENIPVFILGSGTNLLVSDGGIEGIAVSLEAFRSIEFTKETDDRNAVLYVSSGVPLAMLVSLARKYGYSGIEALAGIPGSVGGSVSMNAGSFGTEIKDVITSVALMDMGGDITVLKRDELDFSYRSSNLPEGSIILSVNVRLKKDDPDKVIERTKDFLEKKKNTQPLGESSAGCVFKNPEGDAAGRLIDAAGCKGMKKGDVEVSAVHANYFINRGKASCADFIGLMETVRNKVQEHSGIVLEPEIKIVGRNLKK